LKPIAALEIHLGADIGVEVVDLKVEPTAEALKQAIRGANEDETVSGIIVQLPLMNSEITEEVLSEIAPEKDVDGLSGQGDFDSATATAINWLLTGYNIDLKQKKIAIVGRGRLVGRPLASMWRNSGLNVEVFHRGSDFSKLRDYDVIVTATGAPDLITDEMIRSGAVIVDAGTASEGGRLVGDISDEIRLSRISSRDRLLGFRSLPVYWYANADCCVDGYIGTADCGRAPALADFLVIRYQSCT